MASNLSNSLPFSAPRKETGSHRIHRQENQRLCQKDHAGQFSNDYCWTDRTRNGYSLNERRIAMRRNDILTYLHPSRLRAGSDHPALHSGQA